METLFTNKGLVLLVELLIKSSLVLIPALLFSFFAGKQPASTRHMVLGLSLMGLLLLPFLTAFAPSWQTGILPAAASDDNGFIQPSQSSSVSLPGQLTLTVTPGYGGTVPAAVSGTKGLKKSVPMAGHGSQGSARRSSPWVRWGFFALWYVVPGLILLRLLSGLYGISRLSRHGVFLEGFPWRQLFLLFREKFSLKRRVRLVKHSRVRTPMTWGLFKPVVLMPPDVSSWPLNQSWPVLFHELSHIKRWDFMVTLLARLSCALFWFNPLSWMALKRLRREQEKACDEMVLKSGIKPSTYASSLLRIKQGLDRGGIHTSAALAMAGGSEISERLTTILDKHFKLKEIKMKTKILLTLAVFLTVTFIGTAAPAKKDPAKPKVPAAPAAPAKPAKPAESVKSAVPAPPVAPAAPAKTESVPAVPAVPASATPVTAPEAPPAPETPAKPATPAKAKKADKKEKEKKEKKEKKKKKGNKISIKADRLVVRIDEKDHKTISITPAELKGKLGKNLRLNLDGKVIQLISDGDDGKTPKTWTIKTVGKGKDGKDGKGKNYILLSPKGDKESVEIIEAFVNEEDGHYSIILQRDPKKGNRVQMDIMSGNRISDGQLSKIKALVQTLRGELPKGYQLSEELSLEAQKITIQWPLNLEKEAHVDMLDCIKSFEKDFKKVYETLKDKKPLKKKVYFNLKKKESKKNSI